MIRQRLSRVGFLIRPIQPADRHELSRFYAGLSADSRLARFHAVGAGIGDEAASLLCGPDHEHREGFVAEPTDALPGDPEIVGHLCLEPGDAGLEMALAVADACQGRGLGRALLLAALDWAKDQDVALLKASMLSTNSAVLGLIASIGRPVQESTASAGVVLVTIDVGQRWPKAA
jgi:GNAT superfamily N-acetyltransferase